VGATSVTAPAASPKTAAMGHGDEIVPDLERQILKPLRP